MVMGSANRSGAVESGNNSNHSGLVKPLGYSFVKGFLIAFLVFDFVLVAGLGRELYGTDLFKEEFVEVSFGPGPLVMQIREPGERSVRVRESFDFLSWDRKRLA